MSTLQFFSDGANDVFGVPGQEKSQAWEPFYIQLRDLMGVLSGDPILVNSTWTTADFAALNNQAEVEEDAEPLIPAGATNAVLAQQRIDHASWLARQKAIINWKAKLLQAMHPSIHTVVKRIVQGRDLGVANRTIPEMLDLLDAKFGVATKESIRSAEKQLKEKYTLDQNFEVVAAKWAVNYAFLLRNEQMPSSSARYENVKDAVSGVLLMEQSA